MKILYNLLHLLFPLRENAKLLADKTPAHIRAYYAPYNTDAFTALASYKEPIIRAAIHEIKFHNNEHAAVLLGALLTEWTLHQDASCILVPIPLSSARYRSRGYNQLDRILKHTSYTNTLPALERIYNSTPQSSLARAERLTNLTGAFRVRRRYRKAVAGTHIVLIDDVATTGATFAAARAALLPYHPASIRCIALAH